MQKQSEGVPGVASSRIGPWPGLQPTVWFIVAAVLFLGTAAFIATTNMVSDTSNKDIWQHVAALRTLMDNLTDPSNPFVSEGYTSRHFHPLWVSAAFFATSFGVSVWVALTVATYVSMALLAGAIFLFSRVYFSSPWAPLILLVTLLFAWVVPIQHTGMHSVHTLFYGAVYPATFMISFSLILWAATIRALERKWPLVLVTLLVALMFMVHQLGTVIGLIGTGCFVLLWPGALRAARVRVAAAVFVGLVISLFWPYYNPLMLVLQAGNAKWEAVHNFYTAKYVAFSLCPAIFGILGLRDQRARPLALALVLYAGIFLVGLSGIDIAGRFLMPVVLVLHIGLAAVFLKLLTEQDMEEARLRRICLFGGVTVFALFGLSLSTFDIRAAQEETDTSHIYGAALALTRDLPDDQEVAALDGSAFVIAATGQRVYSVAWPEPGIPDLAQRQLLVRTLFDATLSRQQRSARAQELGVRTLIADRRFIPQKTLDILAQQSAQTTVVGILQKFDLFE